MHHMFVLGGYEDLQPSYANLFIVTRSIGEAA